MPKGPDRDQKPETKGEISRRQFLNYGGRGLLGLAFVLSSEFPKSLLRIGRSSVGLARPLEQRTFTDLLGQSFRLHSDDLASVELQLVEVNDLLSSHSPEIKEAYSLVFKGSPDQPIGQGTHTLEHDAMGRFALFMVPVHSKKPGLDYEAVFCQI